MLSMFKKKDNLEYEFLPAALEIAETPPSPTGRLTIWIIFIILVTAVVWSYYGMVDKVAVARGKVIPDGRLKVIQPIEEGIITSIHVIEGQKVVEGQVLIELDSTMKQVDVDTLQKVLDTSKLEKGILETELSGGNVEKVLKDKNLPQDIVNSQMMLKQARESEYITKKDTLTLGVTLSESELQAAESDLIKLDKNITILKQDESWLKKIYETGGVPESDLITLEKKIEILKQDEQKLHNLYKSGAIPEQNWKSKYDELTLVEKEYNTQKARITQSKTDLEKNWKSKYDELTLAENEYETQKIRIQRAKDKLEESKKNLENLAKERTTNLLNLIVEKDKQIEEYEGSLAKAKKSYEFQKLCSPVNGTVHGLTISTIGGVVTPAQPIMTIVPDGTPLVVEATVLNKDIGFVAVSQQAEVKFDTFPFQKYGTVKGNVVTLSPDAFDDEKLGPVYKMKVNLEKLNISVDGKDVNISPGMSVAAEIKTGKRRIIEFFLEPIVKYTKESLNLR